MFGPRRPFLFEGLYEAWWRRFVGRICRARHALWVHLLLKRLCAQGQAAHNALLALEAVVDDVVIDVVDLGRDDIAVEHLGTLFACERHDGSVVGHAAADDDLLRRVAQRVGHECLCQIAGEQVHGFRVISHVSGALAIPALSNAGAGDEAFEAVVMEGAGAVLADGVARVARDQDVASLGMHHAVHELTAREHASAHAGTDGQIHHVSEALGATKGDLAQAGDVDVGVVAAGNIELVLDGAQQVEVAPCRFGRLQDLAVLGRGRVDCGGAKGADAQRGDALVGKSCVDGLDGLLRSRGRDLLTLQDRAVRIARGADHLGAAGLERSDKLLLCHSIPLSGMSCSVTKI